MQKRRYRGFLRGVTCFLLAALTLWLVWAAAEAQGFAEVVQTVEREAEIPIALLRFALGDFSREDMLSESAALTLRFSPILCAQRDEVIAAWSSELQQLPKQDGEEHEGTLLTRPPTGGEQQIIADNGVPARTLRPSDPKGYTIFEKTYINNASSCALDAQMLQGGFAAQYPEEGPQVLIVHTHGTEAYTMPEGAEYEPSDDHRTLEEEKNMLRIGDEMAATLEKAGITVLHDRTLHDYPNYSGAYNRSLATIESYREQYPTLLYILDVHRDAVTDADGNQYKLVCEEEPHAAQMEFVLGTSGGGLSHDNWRENLKLACAVQETILEDYPTLMRPIVVRNSRYNQQVTTGSLLIEVGTAGNSLEEAIASARIFAEGFAKTVLPG